jgi:hypothetical protein
MSKPSAAGGVCLACKFDPDCIYEAASGRVILQCEQFEMGFRESPVQAPSIPESSFSARSRHAKESSAYPGLCSNCDNRETCIYPKPEGGVWRCEEYV